VIYYIHNQEQELTSNPEDLILTRVCDPCTVLYSTFST
jgi:hypothetical protein